MRDLAPQETLALLQLAEDIEAKRVRPDLSGRLAALLFFEPSTRTHFSFDTAMKRLGGQTLSMSGSGGTSAQKGESLADTLKTISMYADLIVIRSAIEGAARYAAEVIDIPVINAGDGANQHPTQALLDLYSIRKTQGRLEDLSIALVGDLKFGRTAHSLVQALARFRPRFSFVSPEHLGMPYYILEDLQAAGVSYRQLTSLDGLACELDVMYVTRIQRERFADPEEYEKVKGCYVVNRATLAGARESMRVLHPLPRVNEIAAEVDTTRHAYYFQQAHNGVPVRQALLATLLEAAE
ncbi:MAG: aspartate carbamoyltransferase [Spirochaetaceae bacterium]|nr:MAG: aspartate carbamoyltransferase [Spirochaetaceae bacterium]